MHVILRKPCRLVQMGFAPPNISCFNFKYSCQLIKQTFHDLYLTRSLTSLPILIFTTQQLKFLSSIEIFAFFYSFQDFVANYADNEAHKATAHTTTPANSEPKEPLTREGAASIIQRTWRRHIVRN